MVIKNKLAFAILALLIVLPTISFGAEYTITHFRRGMEALNNKSYKEAEMEFNYFLQHPDMFKDTAFGVAYFGRGLLFQKLGNYEKAIQEYTLAIKYDLHPEVSVTRESYMNMGAIHMKQKTYGDAIKSYSKLLEIDPRDGLAHYFLGMAYLKSGDIEKAEKESREAKNLEVTYTALDEGIKEAKNPSAKTDEKPAGGKNKKGRKK